MELFRLHAYSINPQRNAPTPETPRGGNVPVNAELRAILAGNLREARFHERTTVDFLVDPATRTNDVRELVLKFAFGEPPTAKAAALALAGRLSQAMDNRSPRGLFVPTAFKNTHKAEVLLWLFPQESAFRLTSQGSDAALEILQEVFSQKSRHKKAAHFEGSNTKTDFLTGRVLDHQATSTIHEVADFWITRFLQAGLAMKPEAGTRILAKTLREAYDATTDSAAKECLHNAVLAIRTMPARQTSLQGFADKFLQGQARDYFLAKVPNNETRTALFSVHRETLETVLHFRVLELKHGVYVTSPFAQIGHTVKINTKNGKRILSCEDEITHEKFRSHRA